MLHLLRVHELEIQTSEELQQCQVKIFHPKFSFCSGSHASEATEGSQNGFVKEQQSIDKLLAKIADICSPNKTGRTSALMREHAQVSVSNPFAPK